MNHLIIGGGGFIGSHLADELLRAGHSVRIFDRPNLKRYREFLPDESCEWIDGDYVNQEDLKRVIPGSDVVIHLVSTTLPKSSNDNPIYDVETNLVGTLRLLEISRSSGVKKILFISSGGTVYGVPESVPISESHPTNPICSYGICKLTIEKYLRLFNQLYGLDYTVLRLSNPFGERQGIQSGQGAVAVFLNKAVKGETIEIWGDGSVIRDYIHISDVIAAMVIAIKYNGTERILNIGSGQGVSLNELVSGIEKVTGRKVNVNYTAKREFDVPISILAIEQAKKELDWSPKMPLLEGLKQMAQWLNTSTNIE